LDTIVSAALVRIARRSVALYPRRVWIRTEVSISIADWVVPSGVGMKEVISRLLLHKGGNQYRGKLVLKPQSRRGKLCRPHSPLHDGKRHGLSEAYLEKTNSDRQASDETAVAYGWRENDGRHDSKGPNCRHQAQLFKGYSWILESKSKWWTYCSLRSN
jgi:hypothetical protein